MDTALSGSWVRTRTRRGLVGSSFDEGNSTSGHSTMKVSVTIDTESSSSSGKCQLLFILYSTQIDINIEIKSSKTIVIINIIRKSLNYLKRKCITEIDRFHLI